MESDKEQARWLIKCVSDGRMTGGMAAEIEDYCFARRTELEKLTAERDHLRILYNTARDGMREVGELLETCRIELAESRAEVERLQGELEEAKLNEQLRGTTAYTRGQMLLSTLKQGDAATARAEASESTAAGLRRALEEITSTLAYPDETIWLKTNGGGHAVSIAYPSDDESEYRPALLHAALAATSDDHARRIKSEALREAAKECQEVMPDDLPHLTYNQLIEMADRLEAANGR